MEGSWLTADEWGAPGHHVYEIECIGKTVVRARDERDEDGEDEEMALWSIGYRRPYVGDEFFYWTSIKGTASPVSGISRSLLRRADWN